MSHGKNAERNGRAGREYWSRRLPGMYSWGSFAKWLTHRKERRKAKIELRKRLQENE